MDLSLKKLEWGSKFYIYFFSRQFASLEHIVCVCVCVCEEGDRGERGGGETHTDTQTEGGEKAFKIAYFCLVMTVWRMEVKSDTAQ